MMSMMALCFCTIVGRSGEDCKYSTFFAAGLCEFLSVVWDDVSAKS